MEDIKKYLGKRDNRLNLIELMKYDQMNIEKGKGTLFFNKFLEGEINFLPSYKLIVGTHDYVLEDTGDRIPGWTDRILLIYLFKLGIKLRIIICFKLKIIIQLCK